MNTQQNSQQLIHNWVIVCTLRNHKRESSFRLVRTSTWMFTLGTYTWAHAYFMAVLTHEISKSVNTRTRYMFLFLVLIALVLNSLVHTSNFIKYTHASQVWTMLCRPYLHQNNGSPILIFLEWYQFESHWLFIHTEKTLVCSIELFLTENCLTTLITFTTSKK